MSLVSIILSVLLWIGQPASATMKENSIDPIVAAIQGGSSSHLARYFESSIALNINGNQGDYSKNQAEIVLREFFRKNPPQDFSLVFKNENPSSLSTYIGEYSSSQGLFKVFIKVSQASDTYRIYSLDFVKS